MAFQLPDLPYAVDALQPVLSAETLQLHHGKHQQGYINKLNKLLSTDARDLSLETLAREWSGGVFRNAAQAWNHEFYWKCMTPGGAELPSELKSSIESAFGNVGQLRDRFLKAAAGHFGSGWAWLVLDPDQRLEIMTTHDADTPARHDRVPLLGCDVWEHAYYVDYRNDRKAYLGAWWSLVDWHFVARNLVVARRNAGTIDSAR